MASRAQTAFAQRLATDIGILLPRTDGVNDWATRRFVRTFQDAFQLGSYADRDRLTVDGDPGPKTEAAIRYCLAKGLRASENFSFPEFVTKGSRAVSWRNHGMRVTRDQVRSLQRLRSMIAQPLYLLSTYRDPAHNLQVGGAKRSQHLYGKAADIDRDRTGREITEAEARAAGFGGVGMLSRHRPGRDVIHVDVRSTATRWYYT